MERYGVCAFPGFRSFWHGGLYNHCPYTRRPESRIRIPCFTRHTRIRYQDGSARGTDKESYDYVIFDDKLISVRQKYARDNGAIRGVFDGKTAYLVAGNIPKGEALGVFLHEMGEHASMQTMLGARYAKLVEQFNRLVEAKDPAAIRAAEAVPGDTKPEHIDSERLAYLIEQVTNANEAQRKTLSGAVKKLWAEFVAAVRAWFYRTPFYQALERRGIAMKLTPQDVAALARAAVGGSAAAS